MTTINRFINEYRWLSNFWPVIVKLDEVEYATVEHAYQAAKTLNRSARRVIELAASAGQAKHLGKTSPLRPNWSSLKVGVMLNLLRQKFSNPELKVQLLATDDTVLIEGNAWGDTFWGVCNGKGQNVLGKLLMQVRTELQQDEQRQRDF